MIKRLLIPVACLLLVFFGCAVKRTYSPVTDFAKPYELKWMTVYPPTGSNWYLGEKGNYEIAFYKRDPQRTFPGNEEKHTFYCMAMNGSAGQVKIDTKEDFLSATRLYFSKLSGGRFKLLDHSFDYYTEKNTDCVKYDAIQQETGNPIAEGGVFTITAHGFMCRHPYNPKQVVHAFYSERFLSNEKSFVDETLKSESEEFLKRVAFSNHD